MGKKRISFLFVMVAMVVVMPVSGAYCPQIPADCFGCPSSGTFIQCTTDPQFLSCFQSVSYIVRGRLFRHPEDTGEHLDYNNPGDIGRFVVDDVIFSSLQENETPVVKDTVETAWGGGCFSWYFPDSLPVVVAFQRIRQVLGSDSLLCSYIPGCGIFRLGIVDENVIGKIAPGISEMAYNDFKAMIGEQTAAKTTDYSIQPSNQSNPISIICRNRQLVISMMSDESQFHGTVVLHSLDGKKIFTAAADINPGSSWSITFPGWLTSGLFIVECNGEAILLPVK